MRTIRSSAEQPEPGGRLPAAMAVMSAPMMAKSPSASSRMSGQLLAQKFCSGEVIPRRRVNMTINSHLGSNKSTPILHTRVTVAKHPQIHSDASAVIKAITRERKRLKMSRYRLSKVSGVSQQMIGYVEKGERIPSLEVACRLIHALGLAISLNRIPNSASA